MDGSNQARKVNNVIREAIDLLNSANLTSTEEGLEKAMDEFVISHESAESLIFCYMRTQNVRILDRLLRDYTAVLTDDELAWVKKRQNKSE